MTEDELDLARMDDDGAGSAITASPPGPPARTSEFSSLTDD